jgi:hypothetical protein
MRALRAFPRDNPGELQTLSPGDVDGLHGLGVVESTEHVNLPAESFELRAPVDDRSRETHAKVSPALVVPDFVGRAGEAHSRAFDLCLGGPAALPADPLQSLAGRGVRGQAADQGDVRVVPQLGREVCVVVGERAQNDGTVGRWCGGPGRQLRGSRRLPAVTPAHERRPGGEHGRSGGGPGDHRPRMERGRPTVRWTYSGQRVALVPGAAAVRLIPPERFAGSLHPGNPPWTGRWARR